MSKLNNGDEFVLKIKCECTMAPGAKEGTFSMTVANAKVLEDGKEIGSVSGTIGAGIQITRKSDGAVFLISPEDIWTAFTEEVAA